jgi:hypothetical protein
MAIGLMVTYTVFIPESDLRSLGTQWDTDMVPVTFLDPMTGQLTGGQAPRKDVITLIEWRANLKPRFHQPPA